MQRPSKYLPVILLTTALLVPPAQGLLHLSAMHLLKVMVRQSISYVTTHCQYCPPNDLTLAKGIPNQGFHFLHRSLLCASAQQFAANMGDHSVRILPKATSVKAERHTTPAYL